MSTSNQLQPIVLYMIKNHPLQQPGSDDEFRWIGQGEDLYRDLEDLIGPYAADEVSVLVDQQPAGKAWHRLLDGLLEGGRIRMLVTHLAPLSPAQRQQLVGLCDHTGVQLITPADAGRNRESS